MTRNEDNSCHLHISGQVTRVRLFQEYIFLTKSLVSLFFHSNPFSHLTFFLSFFLSHSPVISLLFTFPISLFFGNVSKYSPMISGSVRVKHAIRIKSIIFSTFPLSPIKKLHMNAGMIWHATLVGRTRMG